jgi:elongation factor 3
MPGVNAADQTKVDELVKKFGADEGAAAEAAAMFKAQGTPFFIAGSEAFTAVLMERKNAEACAGCLKALLACKEESGSLSEASLIKLLPAISECFNDRAEPVRAAALALAESMMRSVTPLAVPTLLPTLFAVLQHKDWQVKEGGLKCIMWLAEVQRNAVGACLVEIVPAVSDCLSDTKKQVSKAARDAMAQACLVIANPDILPLVPDVIKTIGDVTRTEKTMDKLLATTFVTQIDKPTLAIMVPILLRSLVDRRQLMKRKAALVIDNMCKLVAEPTDMAPFGPILEPKLSANADEIASEEIREFCARALETLRRAMGDAATAEPYSPPVTPASLTDLLAAAVGDKAPAVMPVLAHSALMCHYRVLADERLEPEVPQTCVKPYVLAVVGGDEALASKITEEFTTKAVEIIAAANKEEEYVLLDDDLCHIKFSLAYGGKVLLQNTKMHLKKGKRYGLIGPNGVGKTTLMRAISNNQLDEFPNDILRTIFVEHDLDGVEEGDEGPTVMEWITTSLVGADTESIIRKENTDEQIVTTMKRMGFDDDRLAYKVGNLSGGWKMKLSLSRAMLYNAQIMMLDEPTNHMDTKKVQELVDYLNGLKEVTCLLVSHDTKFLDNVCTDILHYETRKLVNYPGNLSAFVAVKPEAKSYYELKSSQGLVWNFPDPGFLEGIKTTTKAIAKCTNITFAYPGTTKNILINMSVQCALASRVACVGPNGAGKSTLVKCLVGEHEPQQGEVWKHPHLRMAYVSQHAFHHVESHLTKSPVEYVQWRYSGGVDKESEAKDTLQFTDEEIKRMTVRDPELKKAGINQVKKILGRRKRHNEFEYECEFVGVSEEGNDFVSLTDLENMMAMGWHKDELKKMITSMDEKLASQNSIVAQRALTTGGIQGHLDAFGLESEFGTYGKIKGLSGGQKVKVVMGASMWNCPHLLVLDEPTNYLDRESLGAMAAAIRTYKGGVLLITHNSEFSQTVCPETWNCDGSGGLAITGAEWMEAAEKARAAAEKKAALTAGFDADKEDKLDAFGNKIVEETKKPDAKLSRKDKLKDKKKKKGGDDEDYAGW